MRQTNRAMAPGVCVLMALGVCISARGQSAEDVEFFEKKIRPVLVGQCFKCHSSEAKKLKGGLRVDSRELMFKGGETGPAVVEGRPNQSLLIKAIRWTDKDLQMPPKEQLPASVVADFERWVAAGAVWPGTEKTAVATTQSSSSSTVNYAANYDHIRKELWSWWNYPFFR